MRVRLINERGSFKWIRRVGYSGNWRKMIMARHLSQLSWPPRAKQISSSPMRINAKSIEWLNQRQLSTDQVSTYELCRTTPGNPSVGKSKLDDKSLLLVCTSANLRWLFVCNGCGNDVLELQLWRGRVRRPKRFELRVHETFCYRSNNKNEKF